ncbi:hypothetical protein [Bradyrhizobium betae]|uniref:Uncharacterized protein n=1 Tax=Bradyrhizobium betae TaxID=244734 RepID=A0A5P6NZ76_9BRAD|nr:hypothetical protein [Bradyrhizobium betae]MCS3725451.1 hypothetical protein [Bradyrhizobium betae]QFI71255.1 hypothetical protein F8237_02015 [Bradyrhizobium betae]
MTATSDLRTITHALRHLCLSRWTEENITDHVAVKLPAPIFDRLSTELQQEMPALELQAGGIELRALGHLTFGGIKFERVDGAYWSVSRHEPAPDASGSYAGTGSAFWNKDHEGR